VHIRRQGVPRGEVPGVAAHVAVRVSRIKRVENGRWGCRSGNTCDISRVKLPLRRGESQERGESRYSLEFKGRKPSRGYPNPGGGNAAAWTVVAIKDL